jgi:hypothetical protein
MGINAKEFESRTALGKVHLASFATVVDAANIMIGVAPCDGEIVGFIVGQLTAGTTGVDVSYALKRIRQGGLEVAVTSTSAKITLAAGVGASVDVAAKIAAIAGCVRPILSTTKANRMVKKGDIIYSAQTQNGAYNPFPIAGFSVAIKPTI